MKPRALLLAPALAVALLASGACGGGVSQNPPGGDGGSSGGGGSSSGGSGSSSGGSGSSSGATSGCPATTPTAGQACAPGGLTCEYGSDPDPTCNTTAICEPNGKWITSLPPGGAPGCPTNPPGSGGCPASYGAVPVEKPCKPNGLECGYPQGRCACTTPLSGPPGVQTGPVWACEQPAAGCPEPRPTVGGACSIPPGVSCDYGSCTLPSGTTLQCASGHWTAVPTACAN